MVRSTDAIDILAYQAATEEKTNVGSMIECLSNRVKKATASNLPMCARNGDLLRKWGISIDLSSV